MISQDHKMYTLRSVGGVLWDEALPYIQSLPITVPAGLAAFSGVAMLLLVWNRLYTWPVWVLGLVAAIAAMRVAHRLSLRSNRPGSRDEQVWLDVVVSIGIVIWLLANVPFTSQRLFTDRDPATYGVAAAWLVHHADLHIPKLWSFGGLPEIAKGSGAGFGASSINPHEVFAQGSHLLPVLLGLAGRVVGYNGMFHVSVLFGAIALLAVYAFARLIMKPRWAALATVSLSLTLPFLYFTRNTYTEPLTLIFIFATLVFVWYAQQTRQHTAWLLAGLCLGAGTLARIDAFIPVVALEAFMAVRLCTVPVRDRVNQLINLTVMALPTMLLSFLAWVDLSQLSSGYYLHLQKFYFGELLLVALVTLAGACAVMLTWRTTLMRRIYQSTIKQLPLIISSLVGLFFVVLALRPLRYIRTILSPTATFPVVNGYAFWHYDSLALYWVLWYLPMLTVLAAWALVWLWSRLVKGKDPLTMPIIFVVTAESLLYLVFPAISTDQLWATRRFLPIVYPGFAILGALLIEYIFDKQRIRIKGVKIDLRVLAASLATLAIISPLFVSNPFLGTRTFVPELQQIDDICAHLPGNAVVVWVGGSRNILIEPTQTFCNVPSFGLTTTDPGELHSVLVKLAAVAQKENKIVILGDDGSNLPHDDAGLESISTITFMDIRPTYKSFPRDTVSIVKTIKLGVVQSDGSLVPPGNNHQAMVKGVSLEQDTHF